MKKAIIITSIFYPTEAVEKFAKLNNYTLIVVADKKTPVDWNFQNVVYLSIEKQLELPYQLIAQLPYNHYCRKMIGYLWAIERKFDLIIDTDDDNIPKGDWNFPDTTGNFDTISGFDGFINIYQLFTDQNIWPRGLPLHLIKHDFKLQQHLSTTNAKIGVWQGLADEDADVDAVYRLTSDKLVNFKNRNPVVLDEKIITPFNSQNTMIVKELFPLLYLPTYVTFRFTDILRGLIAQPIMWLYGYRLGFLNATVVQKRNPHDYMKDFISEIPMYLYCEKTIEVVTKAISKKYTISENLVKSYEALLSEGIICEKEVLTLNAWLDDLKNHIR